MKKINFNKEARQKLLEGCEIMAKAVGTTYSPAGRNVVLGRQWGLPIVVHDGVTVAKEVEVKDEFAQLGIDLIREAATKQVSEVGDGTTVTTLLSYSIVKHGMNLIDEKGINPMILRKQILKALPSLVEEIKTLTQKVKTTEQIRHVAYVSANDDAIADAVTQAVEKVGADGLIIPEMHARSNIEVSFSNGMELNRGYGQYWQFVTNPDRMEAVIEDAHVLVLGRKVSLLNEMQPLLEVVIANGSKNIVIIGEVSGDALAMVLTNKIKGNISSLVIAPPDYGDTRRDTLDDIALLTGATVVIDEIGMKPDEFVRSFNSGWIGSTKMIISKKTTTNIIKYEPADFKDEINNKKIEIRNKAIDERINMLRQQRDTTESIYDKEKILERIARLTTGIAAIKIGARTETDVREKMERAKDAIPAAQAAAAEGIVPGGGVVLLQIAKSLEGKKLNAGEELLYNALQEPIKKLLENAGESKENQEKILADIKQKGGNFGYNCETEKVEDLIKSGVIDPAKVIRLALEHAVAVASTILTSDASIPIEREEVQTNMQMA